MARMETQYRGHTIYYSENMDEWGISDGLKSAKTLSAAKRQIDKLYLDIRKKSAFDAFLIVSQGPKNRAAMVPAKIIEYHGMKRKSWSAPDDAPDEHEVYVMAQTAGRERAGRQKKDLHRLVKPHDGMEDTIAKVHELEAQIDALKAKKNDLLKAMPRVQIEDIPGLVKAATEEESGDV